jgi:hypothetical protein
MNSIVYQSRTVPKPKKKLRTHEGDAAAPSRIASCLAVKDRRGMTTARREMSSMMVTGSCVRSWIYKCITSHTESDALVVRVMAKVAPSAKIRTARKMRICDLRTQR